MDAKEAVEKAIPQGYDVERFDPDDNNISKTDSVVIENRETFSATLTDDDRDALQDGIELRGTRVNDEWIIFVRHGEGNTEIYINEESGNDVLLIDVADLDTTT